jgi:regulator of protease activity HflC (stomatin/prohibitin superfamily)
MFGLEMIGALVVLMALAGSGIKFVTEYDRLVVFRFGRVIGQPRGPGPTWITPMFESYKKVDLRMVTMSIPMQEIITKDNVSARTAAVCFFRVVDPYKVITKIEDPYTATSQIAQTTLRSVMGQHLLDEILSERDTINAKLQAMIDRQTEDWGIKVNAVEIKDVEIPEGMQRAMARQAEAERERRAKVVAAEGEHQAAEKLALAAEVIASVPGAMQLRQLQSMVEVASEKNSTLIFPIPVELLSLAKAAGDEAASKAAVKIVSATQNLAAQAAQKNDESGQKISLKQSDKQQA